MKAQSNSTVRIGDLDFSTIYQMASRTPWSKEDSDEFMRSLILKEVHRLADEVRQLGQPKRNAADQSKRKPKRARRGGVGLLTIQQAADRLGVHYQTIRNWINANQLPAFKRGQVVLIPEEALTDYQGGQKHGETGQKGPGQKWRGDHLSA